MERTLRGVMADAGVDQGYLADCIHMSRGTLSRKMRTGNFDAKEMRAILCFFKIEDPVLAYDIFLREPSHN